RHYRRRHARLVPRPSRSGLLAPARHVSLGGIALNTATIITTSERMLTLAKRAIVSDDRDTRREEIIATFEGLATDLGKLACRRIHPTNWGGVVMAAYDLHSEAVNADERRSGTFAHLGSETALLTSLHAFSAVLG